MEKADAVPSYLAITDGLHDGIEPTGREIVDYLIAEDPLPGICVIRHMHPEAVRKGVRCVDRRELGSHFTEWVRTAPMSDLDRDQIAAQRFMTAPFPRFWLGLDPHDSPAANANSLQIADRVTMKQLGVAAVMGLENVVVLPDYPFLTQNPEFVTIETEYAPESNLLSQPKFWRDCLQRMVELGPNGMAQLGREVLPDLNFFVKAELLRIDDNGEPDAAAIERISRLEGVAPLGPYFTQVDPMHPLFDEYPGFQPFRDRIFAGYWDDNNHSHERPEDFGFREVDERPRRLAFGSLLLKIQPADIICSDA